MKEIKVALRGVFRGSNFMTPTILGHYKLREGYAELSTGRGILGGPIWGVTVRRGDGEDFTPTRSGLFYSEKSALDRIEELS